MPRTTATLAAGFLVLSAGAAFSPAHAQDVSTNWFRDVALSPDGKTIVFVHAGDLYTVPASGGRAVPLTVSPAYESRPVWSHDGKYIAFASDRHGNDDVFVMPAAGGTATRLTFHEAPDVPSDFTTDNKAVIFESTRLDDVKSPLFPDASYSELYKVSLTGGTPEMILTTPAVNARFDSAGKRLVYEDRKGREDSLRKHHTSSIARDLWIYDVASGKHTKITDAAAEDRDPHFDRSGNAVVFLSERDGDMNVYRMALSNGAPGRVERLTSFEHHPVRSLSLADNGDAAFSWHGDIYVMPRGQRPRKLDVAIAVDIPAGPRAETKSSGATEFAVSPNGKEVAFVVRGDVFVTSVDFTTTRRITNTPEQERSVDFAPDGRSIIYAGERDGSWNVYQATIADEDELYFFSATKIDEKPLIATEAEEFQPAFSPDGKKIAYLHNRHEIRVWDIEAGTSTVALPSDMFYSYADGDHSFDWSPDSRWLAANLFSRGRMFIGTVGLVAADGSHGPVDIANSGYEGNSPNFAMKGGAVLWASERYGERSHGSWGAEMDVIATFLNQDAYDRFRLSKEEHQLRKELEEKRKEREKDKKKDEAKKDDAPEKPADDAKNGQDDDSKDKDAKKKDDKKVEPIEIDWDGLELRTERLTIHSSTLGDFALTDEGDKLFYLARFERGFDLWVRDFREESTKILAKLNANDARMEMSKDGKSIFILANGSLSKIDASSGDRKTISFSADLNVDESTERQRLFEHVWRQTLQKFYRPDMHGVNWAYYRDQYAPKVRGLTSNREFANVLSELLGELNASHTGGRYRPDRKPGDTRTASLGVFFDRSHNGDGFRIAEIINNGPLDRAEYKLQPGDVITHIDGEQLTRAVNIHALLDGKVGDRVRLTIARDGADPRDIVVRPVSISEETELVYQRWVRANRDMVERLSDGRIGYMHVRGMNDPSFRNFYSEALGRHFDKDALIVDTRHNGGGWLHDDLATFLTGTHYSNLLPRKDQDPVKRYVGDSQKRWNKPSALLMNEANYSDAHFFPWTYTELKIGPTVGMPVPGTTTAVWWERLHVGDLIFGIPQVGVQGNDGRYLENLQLEPTHKVAIPPELAARGRDTQIEKAVEVLLQQLGN